MANVWAFIASDEASYVAGALWLSDGGVTVAKGGDTFRLRATSRRIAPRTRPRRLRK
ncbi:hypothetical protein [Aliterella atlantica]|uniref:hypothetical protein n=1 Tax=Aliterella atlantica TaxID=1827278 RepID=UPI0038991919